MSQWQFWRERGGTFTRSLPNARRLLCTQELLSENPSSTERDAAVAGMRHAPGSSPGKPVRTSVSLCEDGQNCGHDDYEREGELTALCITRGFRDACGLVDRNRPQLSTFISSCRSCYTARSSRSTSALVLTARWCYGSTRPGPHGLESAFDAASVRASYFMHGYRYTAQQKPRWRQSRGPWVSTQASASTRSAD